MSSVRVRGYWPGWQAHRAERSSHRGPLRRRVRKRLTPEQFRITRGKDTERAFCGGLLNNKKAGIYVCVCCNLPLFESAAKFESGTGWPSFFGRWRGEHPRRDRSQSRQGPHRDPLPPVRCASRARVRRRAAATGRRYCLNSEALRFVANDN